MFFKFFSICLAWASFLTGAEEEQLRRRIQAHMTLSDHAMAIAEAEEALELYPQSTPLIDAYIRALAKHGEEKKMLMVWESYHQQFPEKALKRELIEEMAWGVLQKASHSSSILMREMTLLAGFFSRGTSCVILLCEGMRDANYAVRAEAVKLASHFRDQKLITEVNRLFKEEKVWLVRQQVIQAIGEMKLIHFQSDLEALISSDESLATEKALAIASLLELLDTIHRKEVERLASSPRAGLRQLACQAIAHFDSLRDLDLLLDLVQHDKHPDVRLEAFQAIGRLHPSEQREKIIQLATQGIKDLNYQVAISAAWLLTLYQPGEGEKAFISFLQDKRPEVRHLSAAALGATGSYALPLTLRKYRESDDPYVRLNLALSLIGQRQAMEEVAPYLKEMLLTKEKWGTLECGLFRAIVNRSKKGDEESEHQLLRLELINLLAIVQFPGSLQAIRDYIAERSWEISATAAALLLTEGDEAAIEIVGQLLKDEQPRIRLHAALILSLWSQEESAIQTLEESYAGSEWEGKTKILEALGRVGSMRSIPFLIEALKEPFQTLRVIAAMALIQCLNH